MNERAVLPPSSPFSPHAMFGWRRFKGKERKGYVIIIFSLGVLTSEVLQHHTPLPILSFLCSPNLKTSERFSKHSNKGRKSHDLTIILPPSLALHFVLSSPLPFLTSKHTIHATSICNFFMCHSTKLWGDRASCALFFFFSLIFKNVREKAAIDQWV